MDECSFVLLQTLTKSLQHAATIMSSMYGNLLLARRDPLLSKFALTADAKQSLRAVPTSHTLFGPFVGPTMKSRTE